MIRNGLVYDLCEDYDDPVYIYGPDEPFTVDGIHYADDSESYCRRPMIELFVDGDANDYHEDAAFQPWSTVADTREWLR